MAALLTSWADIVEAGVVDAAPFEVRARFEAATDLMEQVDLLLEERDVVPAAAVMLAGAALEESLRALMEGCEEEITGSPGISKYAVALRKCDRLTRQEAKNVEAWGGLRNTAAHGHFDEITRDEAKVMSAGVNVFLQAHGVR
jgi:hypothetical protein